MKPLKHYKISIAIILFAMFFANDIRAEQYTLLENASTSMEVIESTYDNLIIQNTLADFEYFNVNTPLGMFTELFVSGYGIPEKQGAPKLPVLRKLIEIPLGATIQTNVISSAYEEYTLEELGLQYPILPDQPPAIKSNPEPPEFVYNNRFYTRNEFLFDELVKVDEMGILRSSRLANLCISPIQYNPVSQTLRFYTNLQVEVIFNNPDIQATNDLKARTNSYFFDGTFKQVINYKPVQTRDYLTKYPVKYVIVSDPMFQATLQPFIQWKIRKGFKVIEAYTNNPAVGTTTTSIKAYLQGLYNAGTATDPAPSFVLFVGDVAQIPAWSSGSHYTDLRYCEYTNDNFPEIYYGRFSATNTSQLLPQINKTLLYEQYLFPDPSYLNEVVMVAGMDNTYGATHANGQINYGTTYYFNAAHSLLSHTYLYPASGSLDAQIIQDVSDGVGFANYTAHCGSSGWGDPSFTNSDVPGLQNLNKYPTMIGNCCQSNRFNDASCFGETLLRADDKGAVAYIGASNNTYWNEDFYWSVGVGTITANPTYAGTTLGAYDKMFHDNGEAFINWYVTQSQIIFGGNIAVTQGAPSSSQYYWEIYHVMGDPSLVTFFSEAPVSNTTYPPAITLGSTEFTVNTEPYGYVAISKDGVLHGAALADSNGVAEINLIPILEPGEALIVVTNQNVQPFIDTIPAIYPDEIKVVYFNHTINDLNGNPLEQAANGDSLLLSLAVKNVGYDSTRTDTVVILISSNSPYITISDNTENYGIILPNQVLSIENGFAFEVSNWTPNEHNAEFILTAFLNDTTWESTFSVIISAPDLNLKDILVLDPNGNNNGQLDPGETAQLSVTIKNQGDAIAENVTATLNSTSEFVTILGNPKNFGYFEVGGQGNNTFDIIIDEDAPLGTVINIELDIYLDGELIAQENTFLVIGQVSALIIAKDSDINIIQNVQSAFEDFGIDFLMTSEFPSNLISYKSIFVLLGMNPTNYVLTEEYGNQLADYLNNGGNLYMEGGDTWAFDAQRTVHPMFNITGLSDGESDLSTIAGQNNAFTYDMSFTFSGNNSYVDRLAAISPAFIIFRNLSPSYTCAVAYNSGTYKTIGASFQFGGLNNGNSPSTRMELLSEYLQFFEVIPQNSLTIELPNSWKMISSNVLPKNQSVENTMAEVDDNLRIMKNSYGKIYIPAYNINTIVNWDIKHGYNVYMTEESTLIIEGRDINPLNTPIEFLPGWHMFSYLRNSPMSVQTALAQITDDFLIVKSETGMYVPSYGINTFGNMQPGNGYYIYILNNTTLTYPANSSYKAVESQVYFNDKHMNLGTGNTMSLILNAENLEEGTEILAKDHNNNVYGNGFVRNGLATLLIWGDDELSDGKNGFNFNEAINLFVSNEFLNINSTNDLIEQTVTDYLSYKTDALAYAEIVENQSNSDDLLCFPQPAKETVNITFTLENETNVSIDILSTNGILLKRINLGNISAGKHTHSINLNEFSTGVYNILLNAGGFIKSEKITVIK